MGEQTDSKIKDIFVDFLKTFKDHRNELKYRTLVSQLPARNGVSIVVDYPDLLAYNTEIATNVVKEPELYLSALNEAAVEVLGIENPAYADRARKEFRVRIRELTDPISLRDISKLQLNTLIMVRGMVVRSSELRPMAVVAAFRCSNQHITYVAQSGAALKKPIKCDTEGCAENKLFELDELKTEFVDFQIIRIQELPEELPPGQLPQTFDVHLIGDIVSSARPGDRIVLTGIVKAESEFSPGAGKLRLFTYRIEGNFLEQIGKGPEETEITREEEEQIKAIAAMPGAYDRLINSVAPSIYGHELHKEASLLLMVGSKQKTLPDGTTLRGDINCLLVGDPGTAKSELLKYVARVSPRALYTSGRGTTAAGLTAAVVREKNGMMMLEAGATVLADLGVACISEDTEIYDGQKLIPVGKLWDSINSPIYLTKTGREAKSAMLPVSTYDKLERADLPGIAYAIMRRRHSGDMIKLDLASGLTLRVTPEHLLKRLTNVKNLWIRADEVAPGDEIRSPVRLFKPATCLDLTPEESYVVGCIYGDGWFGKSNITVSQTKSNEDVVRAIQQRVPSVFAVYDKGEKQRAVGKYLLVSRMYQLYTTDAQMIRKTRFLLRNPSTDNVLMLQDRALWAFIAGVFDTDGDLNHVKGKVTAARIYPAKSKHELAVLLYSLRRLGVYARIHGQMRSIPTIQISGSDITRFIGGIREFSVKLLREKEEIVIHHKGRRNLKRGVEKIVSVKREKYEGYVYDLSVGKYHTYESALVYIHNCIDEFDKMRKEDRDALHEVMEQQSYHPSFEISLADGTRTQIGKYVDGLIGTNSQKVILGKDCQILPLSNGAEIQTCDLLTDTISKVHVNRVSRHKAPDSFVLIKYSNGRKIIVTPEHPVYVYRNGAITTVEANRVTNHDYAPAPREVPNSSIPVLLNSLEEPELLRKKVTFPKNLTLELSRLLGYLVSEGHSYAGSSYEIGFSNTDPVLLTEVQELFHKIFGIMPSVNVKDGVTIQRYISKPLFQWFSENFEELMRLAREKRVPHKILGSSVATIREFLSSAFLGDGSVESESIAYRTASLSLAEDYQDLLHKLGIMSRVAHDMSNDSFKVYIMGDSIPAFVEQIVEKFDKRIDRLKEFQYRNASLLRAHDTLPSHVANEIAQIMKSLGMTHSNYFWEHISRGFGVNRFVVERYLYQIEEKLERFGKLSIDNRDSIRSIRSKLGISQQFLANISGTSRGTIAYLEQGGYEKDADWMVARIRECLAIYVRPLRLELNRLKSLLEYRFFRVSETKVVRNEGELTTEWVYDVTVEPTHNFISKGLILHNTASVAKGGFIATLNARTSILAAANPVFGKYDPYKNILDNVNLPVPLLTRFDLVFIVKDEPDAARDEVLAKHVLDMHAKLTFPRTPPIEFDMLKKYIAYAKKLDPELTEEARNRLSEYYIELRRMAQPGQIAVTPRWLEGLIRLSVARARILLHQRVTEDDALRAVTLMRRMLETVAVDQNTGGKQVDVGVLYGKPLSERNLLETALETFKKLEGTGPSKQAVEDKLFMEELEKTGKFNKEEADKMLKTLYRSGQIYEVKPHFYRRI